MLATCARRPSARAEGGRRTAGSSSLIRPEIEASIRSSAPVIPPKRTGRCAPVPSVELDRTGATSLTRVLLFTGKGGVGKTSIAAATAVRAAAGGRRVLVTSTDPAHSLADVLDQPLGDAPTALAVTGPGALFAQQVDAQARLEQHFSHVRDYLTGLVTRGGLDSVHAEELVLLPGLDELFALIDLNQLLAEGRYELVVVDCAPTAETLRLLTLPEALTWYVDRLLAPGRRVARAVRPLTRGIGADDVLPLPDDEVFATVQRVHRELASVHQLLRDPARSSVRLVVSPERVVVAESLRTATSLSLFGYGVDAVVVNRLLPEGLRDPHLVRWRRRQAEELAAVEHAFAPTPVLSAPQLDDEPIGAAALHRLATAVYANRDEAAVLHDSRPVSLRRDGDEHVLVMSLPFVTEDDLELHRRGGELHLRVAGVRRTLALPAALRRCEVAGARLVRGQLELRFRQVDAAAVTP